MLGSLRWPPIAALLLLYASHVGAAEPEAVRLEILGGDECVDEKTFRNDVHDLGAVFRDAKPSDRARTFRIEIDESGKSGRLIVRDLVFRDRVRSVTSASSCDEVAHALALFVATALDESPPAPARNAPRPQPQPQSVASPSPTTTNDEKHEELVPTKIETVQAPPRLGGGGVVVTGYAAGLTSSTSAEGIRGLAAIRVGEGGTRIGFALAVAQETRDTRLGWGNERFFRDLSKGSSKRAGAFVGWGAPWNDRVVGFGAEAGVLGASHQGHSQTLNNGVSECDSGQGFISQPCLGASSPASFSYISPFLASQIIFQVPIKKFPVRPIASIGALWVVSGPHDRGYSAMTTDLGLVWQAW